MLSPLATPPSVCVFAVTVSYVSFRCYAAGSAALRRGRCSPTARREAGTAGVLWALDARVWPVTFRGAYAGLLDARGGRDGGDGGGDVAVVGDVVGGGGGGGDSW